MIDKLRYWIVKVLVGDATVMLNAEVSMASGIKIRGNTYVSNCIFTE